MRKKVLATLVSFCLLLGLMPTVALADESSTPTPAPVYVSATGDDAADKGDGTQEKPYATLAKAVDAAEDGATIYVTSDLTMSECARYYGKHLTIIGQPGENDADGVITVTRGDKFDTLEDTNRSWYNPAMIEVGGKTDENDELVEQSASLRLENIVLDDGGKKMGEKFLQAGKGTGDNTQIVQDAIIATYNNTATITLGNGAVLKNFGGMSAVRIADGILVMEKGSKIIDDTVTNRTKTSGDFGAAGAIWMQGGEIDMQDGAVIENIVGRAVYADGGKAVINGTISGIVPDADMWQGGSGLAIHARGGASAVIGETGAITGITNSAKSVNADDAKVIATYGSNFDMQKGAEITGITNCTVFYADDLGNDYSHNMLINGKVYNCTTTNSLARSFYGLITIGSDGRFTENTAYGGGGLMYSNNGSRYVIQGKFTENTASNGVFYLANQSGGRVEAVMKSGAEISGNTGLGIRVNNGALFTMEDGKISDNDGIGVRVTGKSGGNKNVCFIMNNGEISGNTGYGILYEFRKPDTQATVKLNGGKVINNNSGNGIQISAVGGTACDAYENIYLKPSVLQNSRKIQTSFGTLTFDEKYPAMYLGSSSKEADNAILASAKAENTDVRKDWALLGTNGLWFKLEDATTLHFKATRQTDTHTKLYAAYIPVDENGVPATDAQAALIPIQYNSNPLSISLENLTPGQSYALRIVQSVDKVDQVIVTFDTDGGTTVDAQTINVGDYAARPANPEKDGYQFDGWYLVTDGTMADEPYDFENTRVLENITLKAKWYNCTVTFDANGGAFSDGRKNTAVRTVSGNTVAIPTAPTRSGYTFDGWNTAADGSGAPFTAETTVDGDKTVYAQWSKNTSGGGGGGGSVTRYTLTYESNGGTTYPSETYSSGKTVKLDKVPTREGYTFTGWYADKGTTDKITSVTMNGNKTVYAGWEFNGALNAKDHVAYVHGYTDGTVGPNRNITRAETAVMLYRLLTPERSEEITTTSNSFSDVPVSAWYSKGVSSMANGGYVTGYSDGTFGGDKSITRAEFVTMMVRFVNPAEGTKTFTDVPETYWAYQSISTATAVGWIAGYSDGSFGPEKPITRAEVMTIINRVLNRGVDEDSELLDFKQWPDNKSSHWFYYDVIEATNGHEYTGSRPSEDWTKILK